MKYDVVGDLYDSIPHKIRDHSINQGKIREMFKKSEDFEQFIRESINGIKFQPNRKELKEESGAWKKSAETKSNTGNILCMDETHVVLYNESKQVYIESNFQDHKIYILTINKSGCYIEQINYKNEESTVSKKEFYDKETLDFLEEMYKISDNKDIRTNFSKLIKEKAKESYILPDEEIETNLSFYDNSQIAEYINHAYRNEHDYINSFFKKEIQRTRTK